MADFSSHTRLEHELAPHFRERLNHAESSEDVKKFFAYTMRDLLSRVLGAEVRYEDVALDAAEPGYRVSTRIEHDPGYTLAIGGSDLGAIMKRFAEAARHRARHLEGHPEKTQSKIRGRQG
jgi:hypothetical protein